RDEDKREDDKRGDDERGDDERGDDERGDDERGDDERNFDKADAKEVEKSLKDMRKNLKNFDKKEWKQLTKRLDRIEKNYNKFLERLDKMAEKDDVDLGDLKEKVDELKEALEAISKEADSQQSAMDNLVSKVQREIDAVDSRSITWDELNQLWTEVRKVDVYWMIRDGLDMRVNAEERYENLLEMEKEISRMRAQMEVDDAVSEKLDDILKFIEDFDSNRTNALEAYEEILDMAEEVQNFSGDMRDMDDAMRDMWDQMDTLREGFQDMNDELQDFMEDSWETIDEGWNSGHDKMFYEDMKREIENISETLKLVVELKELLADNENERVKTAVTKLAELAEKAKSTLDGLKKRLEDDELDPEVFESAWDVLERIGQSAESSMEVLHKYYKDLPKDAQEIVDMLEKDDGGPRGGGKDKFRDVYGGLEGQDIDIDNIVRQIKDEVLDQVMRAVSQELMKELAPYLGEKVVAEILNNIGALGKDGEKLLASSTEVYGRIAEVDDGNMSEKLRELAKRTEKTLIVASLKDSFKEKWAEVATAAEAGDKERMKSLESEIEALLADNFEKSTTGEEAYQYRDVLAGEGLWYYSYVLGATKDGDVSGFRDKNGRATGEFKPENNVTQGEALKMVLNSCGVDVVSAPPPQPWMPTDHWAVKEGYLPMAVKLGIDQFIDLKNPNKTATREDVAVMFAEACSLDTSEDQTAFSDYNGRFGGHVQAVYNAKIFTGQGDTGNFDGAKNINRAAMTKAMEVAKGSVRAGSVIDDLDAFEDVLGGSKKAFPSPTPNDEE
ncbi:S-layer homology domain-containing protein, partial [Candidatus Peregrinibacteria bacterium]|nr:S-layer homology domain-containing protein [Candidatus Peregrinibacteria bacterium]